MLSYHFRSDVAESNPINVMYTATESNSTSEINGIESAFGWKSIVNIHKSSDPGYGVLDILIAYRIMHEVNVDTQRDEHMRRAERGMNCAGRALMRRRSSQELQGMRMTEHISTANNNWAWIHDDSGMTGV